MFLPISPPSASSSLTRWPLEVPPIFGLQGIIAMLSTLTVKSCVLSPSLAQASAASQPAWPAPTTTTSTFSVIVFIIQFSFHFVYNVQYLSILSFFARKKIPFPLRTEPGSSLLFYYYLCDFSRGFCRFYFPVQNLLKISFTRSSPRLSPRILPRAS